MFFVSLATKLLMNDGAMQRRRTLCTIHCRTSAKMPNPVSKAERAQKSMANKQKGRQIACACIPIPGAPWWAGYQYQGQLRRECTKTLLNVWTTSPGHLIPSPGHLIPSIRLTMCIGMYKDEFHCISKERPLLMVPLSYDSNKTEKPLRLWKTNAFFLFELRGHPSPPKNTEQPMFWDTLDNRH